MKDPMVAAMVEAGIDPECDEALAARALAAAGVRLELEGDHGRAKRFLDESCRRLARLAGEANA